VHVQDDRAEPQDGTHFTQTQWTLVVNPAGQPGPQQRQALDRLLRLYYTPLQNHLQRQFRLSQEQAADLLQGFVADKVLSYGLIARANRTRGRFRGFLVTALDRYTIDALRAEVGRRAAPLDAVAEPVSPDQPEAPEFERDCDRSVVQEIIRVMKLHYQSTARMHIWGIFEDRILTPAMQGTSPPGYEELVRKWNLKSPTEAYNALANAKRMFAQVRQEVMGA
jgi:DNA-directed RNA polymerase specialized sigma24 family protein